MNSLAKNVAVLLVAVLLALVLAEAVLRLAIPRYEYAAASVHERDAGRLIVRTPVRTDGSGSGWYCAE